MVDIFLMQTDLGQELIEKISNGHSGDISMDLANVSFF
jgi:hypothetical protein